MFNHPNKTTRAPAGSQLWKDGSLSIPNGGIGQNAKYDTKTARFDQTVTISHTDVFTLTPITLTEGPLKGRHVVLLDDPATFRFLDLPAEIRTIVYGFLVQEDDSIQISTLKPQGLDHRAIRTVLENRYAETSKGKKVKTPGKQVVKWEKDFAVASTNKQMAAEALPVIYGNNKFNFAHLLALKAFLDCIESNRKYLRHISFSGSRSYYPMDGGPTFYKLRGAINLRSLRISHNSICGTRQGTGAKASGVTLLDAFVEDVAPFLQHFHKATAAKEEAMDVLDLIEILPTEECALGCRKTSKCKFKGVGIATCRKGCKNGDMEKHLQELWAKLRKMLAEKLGVSDRA